MEDPFVFSAQSDPVNNNNETTKNTEGTNSSKRARVEDANKDLGLRSTPTGSFKSKLLSMSSPNNWKGVGTGKEPVDINDEDISFVEGPIGPSLRISKELKEKLYQPWANALILKLMGRTHTLSFMLQKLKQKWSLIGHWQLTDLNEGYFVARFQMLEDMEYVLTGGPWVIANQYLVPQRWKPNFIPGKESIQSMPIWLRLNDLPMELMTAGMLRKIGGMLGTTCKVDPITINQARGRYARICVKIDISKPLKESIDVEDNYIKVEYENLGRICFNCGKFGHSQINCPDIVVNTHNPNEADGAQPENRDNCIIQGATKEKAGTFGPWMMVSYNKGGKNKIGNGDGRKGSASNLVIRQNGIKNTTNANHSNNGGYNGHKMYHKEATHVVGGNKTLHTQQKGGASKETIPEKLTALGSYNKKKEYTRNGGSRFQVLMDNTEDSASNLNILKQADSGTNLMNKQKGILKDISNIHEDNPQITQILKSNKNGESSSRKGKCNSKKVHTSSPVPNTKGSIYTDHGFSVFNYKTSKAIGVEKQVHSKEAMIIDQPITSNSEANEPICRQPDSPSSKLIVPDTTMELIREGTDINLSDNDTNCDNTPMTSAYTACDKKANSDNKVNIAVDEGAGKKSFPKTVLDLKNIHNFDMIAILEPRISGIRASRVIKRLGFSDSFILEANGFSGGIWILWNNNRINMQVLASSKQSVTLLVDDVNKWWVLTIVYASPIASTRKNLWRYLNDIRNCFVGPWVIMGDFNEITNSTENRGGRSNFSKTGFSEWIDNNDLVDMGFLGPKFTWMNKRGVGEEIWVRLDRALCTIDWRITFAEGLIKHLPRINSDHCPLFLKLHSSQIPRGTFKPFRFEAMWLKDKRFKEFIRGNWDLEGDVNDKISRLTTALQVWNKEVFGCIFHRKRHIMARLQGIQCSLSKGYKHHLVILEGELLQEYNDIINQEEIFWLQKSRNTWLKEGDKNTKFFHMSTLIRRRHNKLEGIKNKEGCWINDISSMKMTATDYFKQLFSKTQVSTNLKDSAPAFYTLSEDCQRSLSLAVQEEEIKESLFNIGGLKAPGPDGMPAIFFQNNWDICKNDIVYLVKDCLPLIHGRVTNQTYKDLIAKVKKRLTGWKSATLSLAGRITLVNSVTAALPIYTMQTVKLPNEVCSNIDKINRNFIWGHIGERKPIHLIKWDTVCLPKNKGGLGVKNLKHMNQALLAKSSWRLLHDKEGLWAQILSSKYLKRDSTVINENNFPGSSSTWKGIVHGAKIVAKGLKWRVGNGATILFWMDDWVPDIGILKPHALIHLEERHLLEHVNCFFRDGDWNLSKLETVLPWFIIHKIAGIHAGKTPSGVDRTIWNYTNNGDFSVRTAYACHGSRALGAL
ncbi:hypothetical protein ACOSQ4_017031 [Xanthoceras sorbifolium]